MDSFSKYKTSVAVRDIASEVAAFGWNDGEGDIIPPKGLDIPFIKEYLAPNLNSILL
jgi:hypothetical protein